MPTKGMFRESRRSTRVPLKLTIAVEEDVPENLMCDGETIFANLHGALISSAIPLPHGAKNLDSRISDGQAGHRARYLCRSREFAALRNRTRSSPQHLGVALPPHDWSMDPDFGRG